MQPTPEKYKYEYTGKLDMETGYYYGVYPDNFGSARYYNPTLSQWLSTDPLAEKYPNFSPYTYTADNPVMLVDPDGRILKGVRKKDVKILYNNILEIFSGKKFKKLRALLVLKGKKFKKIKDFKNALENLDGDDLIAAKALIGVINSHKTFKIEYFKSFYDKLTRGGSIAITNFFMKLTKQEREIENYPILQANVIEKLGGDGFTMKTSNGIHSFVHLDKNQALNTWHELMGHGIPAVLGANDMENSHDAIRYENLIRRVMGIKKFRDGSHHNGGVVPNPQALPKYLFNF